MEESLNHPTENLPQDQIVQTQIAETHNFQPQLSAPLPTPGEGNESGSGIRLEGNNASQDTRSSGGSGLGFGPGLTPQNPYPVLQPGSQPAFLPYGFPFNSGRPEPGDPLYTSPADGPELRLISIQLTGQENYNTWARDFRRALVTKEKDGFIDGIVSYPTDERQQRLWRKCNQLVRTWIGNCLAPDVAAGLPPTEDSKTIWANIREMYGRLDPAKLFTITQAISDLKQGNSSVAACFNRLSALWNELEAAEERLEGPDSTLQQYRAIKEREKVTRFLLILNDTYSPFRSQILAMDPMPSLGRIYQLAVQEESQRQAASEHGRVGEEIGRAHV